MKRFFLIFSLVLVLLILPTLCFAQGGIMGDINLDGTLNTADAVIVLKYSSNAIDLTESQVFIADANLDEQINTADAVYILQVVAGTADANIIGGESFTVTYVMPEGISATAPKAETVQSGTVYTISPVKYNSYFLGWTADFNDMLYQPSESFIMPEQNVILSAKWDMPEKAVTVSYYDSLNDINVSTETITTSAQNITADLLTLPEGFMLENEDISIPAASSVTVAVYPYEVIGEDTYRVIKNYVGFNRIRNNLTANYCLATDIDLMGENFLPIGWKDATPNTEITAFTGKFDGKGYTISDLYIDYHGQSSSETYKNAGLFAINEGEIRNIVLYTNMPSSSSDYYYGIFGDRFVGSICGTNSNLVSGCRVYGYLGTLDMYSNAGGKCGGICGLNNKGAVIENCSFEGALDGFYWVGGLVGMNYGTLKQSYFAGSINGTTGDSTLKQYNISFIGGLCGGQEDSVISDCYVVVTGYISAWSKAGGMIGWFNRGQITNCFIVDPQIYGHENLGYVEGYLPNGDDSLPTLEGGLYLYTTNPADCGGGGLYSDYSTDIWAIDATFLSHIPDLIDCRRGTSWFNAYQ